MRERIRRMSYNEVMSAGRWTIRRENDYTWSVWTNGENHSFSTSQEVADFVAR